MARTSASPYRAHSAGNAAARLSEQQPRDRLGRLLGACRCRIALRGELLGDRGDRLARRRGVAFRGFCRPAAWPSRHAASRAAVKLGGGEHRVDHLGLGRGLAARSKSSANSAPTLGRDARIRPSSRPSPRPCSRRSRSRPEPPAPWPAPRCRPAPRPHRAAAPGRAPPCRPSASCRRAPTCS